MNEEVELISDDEAVDAILEEKASIDDLIKTLRDLLGRGKTAAYLARLITDEQIQAYHAFKRRTGKRRLNEKESFMTFSLGAANFVTKLQGR